MTTTIGSTRESVRNLRKKSSELLGTSMSSKSGSMEMPSTVKAGISESSQPVKRVSGVKPPTKDSEGEDDSAPWSLGSVRGGRKGVSYE